MREPIDLGVRRELFVDDYLIEEMAGARLALQHPQRLEVAFHCDAAWEDNVAGFKSLVQEGGRVRLYYRASMLDRADESQTIVALAESTDGGRSFTRPSLGLCEFDGGRDNNILSIGGKPGVPPAFVDTNPDCPPDQRYKGLDAHWRKLYALCSADGLRWRTMQDEPVEMDGTFDTINTAFWDAGAGCYRCFTRYFKDLSDDSTEQDVLGSAPTVVRAIQSATSQDFVHWSPVVPHEYDDDFDRMQLYTNATVPCPGAEHIYLAFPNRYVQERVVQPDHPYPGCNDALFMTSRDCVHWKRYPEAWVRPGLDPLNWTDRNNYPTWGIVETSPTEWSIYISEHYRHVSERPRLRRLAIRPHGSVSVHADVAGGEVISRPVTFAGRQLRLNFSTSAAGCVRVEIQDAAGHAIEGFAMDAMEPLFGDALDRPVCWRGGGDLSSLIGVPVRLRFALVDADVFAFRTSG